MLFWWGNLKEEMTEKGKDFIREFILETHASDYYLLSKEQQDLIALIALNAPDKEEEIDILIEIAQKLPDILKKYQKKKLSAENAINLLIDHIRISLKQYIAILFSDIHDELVCQGQIPGEKPDGEPVSRVSR